MIWREGPCKLFFSVVVLPKQVDIQIHKKIFPSEMSKIWKAMMKTCLYKKITCDSNRKPAAHRGEIISMPIVL